MVYASEEVPLGTAGSVRNARQELDEPFIVISGDVLTDIDLSAIVDFHNENKALATMALRSVPTHWSSASSSPEKMARSSVSWRNPPGGRCSRTQ